jgi:hypothetical protein
MLQAMIIENNSVNVWKSRYPFTLVQPARIEKICFRFCQALLFRSSLQRTRTDQRLFQEKRQLEPGSFGASPLVHERALKRGRANVACVPHQVRNCQDGLPDQNHEEHSDSYDKTNPIEASLLYLEYKKRHIPAELHIYAKGGHGFGMRKDKNPVNDWPQRCAEWMMSMGWLK